MSLTAEQGRDGTVKKKKKNDDPPRPNFTEEGALVSENKLPLSLKLATVTLYILLTGIS